MVPEEDVAVESGISCFVDCAPVVIVGCAAVVWFAVAEVAPDADEKYGSVFSCSFGLSFFGCEVGVLAREVFSIYKGDFFGKSGGDMGKRSYTRCSTLRRESYIFFTVSLR